MGKGAKKNKDQKQDQKLEKLSKKIQKVEKQAAKPRRKATYGLSISDKDLFSGAHQSINTIFYPQLGVHRGQAKAFTESALAKVSDSFIIPAGTSTNCILTLLFKPSVPNNTGFIKYEWGTTVGIDASSTNIAAILSSTQAVSYRVLGMEVNITPQGAFTGQAGAGIIGYVPDLSSFTQTSTTIAQLSIKKDFKGVDPMTLHWVPNDSEQIFVGIAAVPDVISGFVGFLSVPSGSATATSFQVDYNLVIEYVPSVAFRPWVTKDKPTIDTRVFKYVNEYAERCSDPLMIGKSVDYLAYLKDAVRHEGGLMTAESLSAATDSTMSHALNDNKNWFQHVVEGDLAGAQEHARAIEYGTGVGLINGALGIVNTLIPGEAFDLPYINSSPG